MSNYHVHITGVLECMSCKNENFTFEPGVNALTILCDKCEKKYIDLGVITKPDMDIGIVRISIWQAIKEWLCK